MIIPCTPPPVATSGKLFRQPLGELRYKKEFQEIGKRDIERVNLNNM